MCKLSHFLFVSVCYHYNLPNKSIHSAINIRESPFSSNIKLIYYKLICGLLCVEWNCGDTFIGVNNYPCTNAVGYQSTEMENEIENNWDCVWNGRKIGQASNWIQNVSGHSCFVPS